MEKTIYLHLGTPKTGSTAFQLIMRENHQLLLDEGIFIPKTKLSIKPMSESSGGVLQDTGKETANKKIYKRITVFLKLFEESGCATAVFSAESLSKLAPNVIAGIASLFKGYIIKPVIVFRHPFSLMMSHFCSLHSDRAKASLSPEQYIQEYIAKKGYIKYGSIVSSYIEAFDSCEVIFYENEISILETLFKKMKFSDGLVSKLLSHSKLLRVSLPPCAALLNHKLSLACNINREKYLNSIYTNIVAFTRTEEFVNLRFKLFNNKEIIVSEDVQLQFKPAIHSELRLLANTIPETIPDSYFTVIKGPLPTDEQVDEIFSNFILHLANQNLKKIHSLNHYVLEKKPKRAAVGGF